MNDRSVWRLMVDVRARALGAAVCAAALVAGCGSNVGQEALRETGGALSTQEAISAIQSTGAAGAAVPSGGAGSGLGTGAGDTVAAGACATSQAGTGCAPAGASRTGGGGVGGGGVAGGRTSGGGTGSGLAAEASGATGAGSGPASGGGAASGPAGSPGTGVPSPTPGTPAAPKPGARGELLFGSMGTGSGVIGRAVQPIIAAVKAWGADINARGGLNGHPVRIIYGDDGGDPAAALAIVKRMVEQDKVLALIGTYLVTTTPAVTPYLEEKQIPMIGGPGGNEIEDHSPMVFNPQTGADEALGHAIHLAVVTQSDKRKSALLYCREASSCAQQKDRAKQFASLYGVDVVFEGQVSIAQPDFTAEVIAARNAGADVLNVLADEQSIVRIARSAHRQGYFPVVAGTYTANAEIMQTSGEDAEGIMGIAATVPYRSSPKMKDYIDAVARYVPGAPLGGYGATAWVQLKLMERLAQIFGEQPAPTTADILDALYSLKDETIGGLVPPITFNKGPHGKVNLCGVPIKVVGGKLTAPHGDTFACARSG